MNAFIQIESVCVGWGGAQSPGGWQGTQWGGVQRHDSIKGGIIL